jgi:hypothetical protein
MSVVIRQQVVDSSVQLVDLVRQLNVFSVESYDLSSNRRASVRCILNGLAQRSQLNKLFDLQ